MRTFCKPCVCCMRGRGEEGGEARRDTEITSEEESNLSLPNEWRSHRESPSNSTLKIIYWDTLYMVSKQWMRCICHWITVMTNIHIKKRITIATWVITIPLIFYVLFYVQCTFIYLACLIEALFIASIMILKQILYSILTIKIKHFICPFGSGLFKIALWCSPVASIVL